MIPWREYLLKGLFIGLWVFFALQVPSETARVWIVRTWVLGWVCAGLATGLILGAALQILRGLRPQNNWFRFPFVVVLESPTFIYCGIMVGLIAGIISGREFAESWSGPIASAFGFTFEDIKHQPPVPSLLEYCTIGGLLLGLGLYRMRQVEDRSWRFWVGFSLTAFMVYLAVNYTQQVPGFGEPDQRFNMGISLLLGVPFFYLLTFCGDAEESEVEVMTFCALVGAAISLIGYAGKFPAVGPLPAYLIVLALYFVYGTRLMYRLRVFKYVVRAANCLDQGRLSPAIQLFRQALELDPQSQPANQGMLALHHGLTLDKINSDPGLAKSLDFTLCLDRSEALLMMPPTPEKLNEANQFLELVGQMQPAYSARVDYLRVISLLHKKEFDVAATTLSRLLNPETPGYHPVVRKHVLYDAWDFALRAHPKLVERLGWDELNKPGRRMEAISAIERRLIALPEDATAKEFRTVLYSQISEAEFVAAIGPEGKPPKDFAYEYVEQLGLALVDNPDPQQRERGMDFLRIAGRGLPERGPGIFLKLAQVYEKQDDLENMRKCLETAKKVALAVGPGELARDQRQFYFDSLRKLADLADKRGDYEVAIEELRQYQTDGGTAALETYRKLAELYGKTHDAMNALLMTETGLTYNSTDPDLLRKKDSFYYSVEPERLEKVKDRVVKWFDVAYCVRKSMWVLNAKDGGLELLDWASHLTKLAKVMKPTSHGVRLIEARVLLRRGERDAGLQILEDIHYSKEKGSGEEEEAWYTTTKLLGQLYLEELGKPDLAMHCFQAYKNYHKSGADTLYQIARCYEAMGDNANAIRFYTAVSGYEGHPLFWDAKDAARRLKEGKQE
jgi:tetratricopeptide (TPR) repeat protein